MAAGAAEVRSAFRRRTIHHLAQGYARLLEQMCLQYPLQWYNFYPLWEPPGDTDYVVLER